MCYLSFFLYGYSIILTFILLFSLCILNINIIINRIYSSCAAVCIFYIYSHISFYTKSEVRLIYALLKLIPICLLFHTSSSISISLITVITILMIGFISGYLKWNNMFSFHFLSFYIIERKNVPLSIIVYVMIILTQKVSLFILYTYN